MDESSRKGVAGPDAIGDDDRHGRDLDVFTGDEQGTASLAERDADGFEIVALADRPTKRLLGDLRGRFVAKRSRRSLS